MKIIINLLFQTLLCQTRPSSLFTASVPIHKSSSTGSFSLGQKSTSAASSAFPIKPNQTDRSASFSFSGPNQPTPTTGPSAFGSAGLFGKAASSGSNPSIFSFGNKVDKPKAGSAPGKTSLFLAPKAVPASLPLAQGGSQGLSEQGRFVQQPTPAQTALELGNKSPYQASAQAAQSSGGVGPQQSGSLIPDLKSQNPASAFSSSQHKTPAGANALSGGKQLSLCF